MPDKETKIVFLGERPEYTETLAVWLYGEWGHRRAGNTPELVAARLRSHTNTSQIPLTVVALQGEAAVGTASLRDRDLEERDDLSPWLASVYVVPARRSEGVGSLLVTAIERIASGLGVERFYLYTPDRQSFYAKLGWTELETLWHAGKPVTVMCRHLSD